MEDLIHVDFNILNSVDLARAHEVGVRNIDHLEFFPDISTTIFVDGRRTGFGIQDGTIDNPFSTLYQAFTFLMRFRKDNNSWGGNDIVVLGGVIGYFYTVNLGATLAEFNIYAKPGVEFVRLPWGKGSSTFNLCAESMGYDGLYQVMYEPNSFEIFVHRRLGFIDQDTYESIDYPLTVGPSRVLTTLVGGTGVSELFLTEIEVSGGFVMACVYMRDGVANQHRVEIFNYDQKLLASGLIGDTFVGMNDFSPLLLGAGLDASGNDFKIAYFGKPDEGGSSSEFVISPIFRVKTVDLINVHYDSKNNPGDPLGDPFGPIDTSVTNGNGSGANTPFLPGYIIEPDNSIINYRQDIDYPFAGQTLRAREFSPQFGDDGEPRWIDAQSKKMYSYQVMFDVYSGANFNYIDNFDRYLDSSFPLPRFSMAYYPFVRFGPSPAQPEDWPRIINGGYWNMFAPSYNGPSAVLRMIEANLPPTLGQLQISDEVLTNAAPIFGDDYRGAGGTWVIDNLKATIDTLSIRDILVRSFSSVGSFRNCEVQASPVVLETAVFGSNFQRSIVADADTGYQAKGQVISKLFDSVVIACRVAYLDIVPDQCAFFKGVFLTTGVNQQLRNSIVSEMAGQFLTENVEGMTLINVVVYEQPANNQVPPGSVETNVIKRNPFFISDAQPFDLSLQSIGRGYPVDSPAKGQSSRLSTVQAGQREVGAYDDFGKKFELGTKVQIIKPFEVVQASQRKHQTNLLGSGQKTVAAESGPQFTYKLKWTLHVAEYMREFFQSLLFSSSLRVKVWFNPKAKPDKYLEGYFKPAIDFSSELSTVKFTNKPEVLFHFTLPEPGDSIEDYL